MLGDQIIRFCYVKFTDPDMYIFTFHESEFSPYLSSINPLMPKFTYLLTTLFTYKKDLSDCSVMFLLKVVSFSRFYINVSMHGRNHFLYSKLRYRVIYKLLMKFCIAPGCVLFIMSPFSK